MALIGGSAGGHLVLLTAYGWKNRLPGLIDNSQNISPAKVKVVVNFYGPYDLTTPFAQNHPLVTGLLGKTWMESPELFRNASPSNWLLPHWRGRYPQINFSIREVKNIKVFGFKVNNSSLKAKY
jgi:acetyl esterase/lipase